jgi:PAS domain-containing protein
MGLIKTQLVESVFAGGGEMGARMRALDWSSTVLGPLEQWPQSLRACLRVILGSGYPMLVCWGPDYTMLYNDAYGPLIGTKHPAALGCSIREVLSETWDYLGPRFDRVMTHGQEASHLTDQMITVYRNNYLEECYFTYSYSPIRDDNGEVGGVFTATLESTERVIEDRRRQVLRIWGRERLKHGMRQKCGASVRRPSARIARQCPSHCYMSLGQAKTQRAWRA